MDEKPHAEATRGGEAHAMGIENRPRDTRYGVQPGDMGGFWCDTSRSQASPKPKKTTDGVVAMLIPRAKTCSDF